MEKKILLSGDWEAGIKEASEILKENFRVDSVALGDLGNSLNKGSYDLVVLCFAKANLVAAPEFISGVRKTNDAIPVFVVSDQTHFEAPVGLIKMGVQEYVASPVNAEQISRMAERHIRLYHMTKKVFFIGDDAPALQFEGMIGRSARMQENFKMIQAVAKSNVTVLITGESGTGKELVAKAIHRYSNRAQYRFVDLNCGAIPRELLENELFGHEKGAFTGAHKRYNGSFEAANRGSLFLDEISEMDPLLQVKLLRVLQERNFMRIGGTEKIEVDVRIVAATNRNLEESISKGLFREDLFYRLNVVNISIPPLRERREDIPLLANHFLEYYSAKNDRIFLDFATDAMEALINYDWPGNVRELENTIERLVVLNNDTQAKLKHLSKHIQKVNRSISVTEVTKDSPDETRVVPLEELEKRAIESALQKFHGNVAIAAKKLQIGQATLYRKIKTYGLQQ